MNSVTPTTEPAFPRRLIPLLIAQALATFGVAFVQMGFFFYTASRWGWRPWENLLLATGQGATYIVGALGAHAVAERLGRKGSITILPLAVGLLSACCGIWAEDRALVVGMMLGFTIITGAFWPAMESIVAVGADAEGMARRLAVYNLFWPTVSAAAVAASGVAIAYWPHGFFFVATIFTALSSVVVLAGGSQEIKDEGGKKKVEKNPQPHVESSLLAQRTLALWLSRIAMPSTYVACTAIGALMPSLPSLSRQTVSAQTAIGSIWMAGRFAAFGVLAWSSFWHTRPRLLIAAGLAMLLTFVAICVPVSALTSQPSGGAADLWTMGIAQFVLGGAVALIYSASLYFGMVLSDGATEHGGYHEALIGLGQTLGPGVAAAAQIVRPGSVFPAVAAVSGLLIISLVASAMRAGKKNASR